MYSKDYEETLNAYKKMHLEGTLQDDAKNTFDGYSLRFFFKPIKYIIDKTKSKTLIDFGCGKARYYYEEIEVDNKKFNNVADYWQINKFILYDPALKKYSAYPKEKAEAVICIDVVEHIPEKDVISFINNIFKLSTKFVFINIACYPAKKLLPDGRNVHLSIKEPKEWKEIISNIKTNYPKISPYIICSTNRKKFISLF